MTDDTSVGRTDATWSEPPASGAIAAIGPRIYGVIDAARPERIAGWAIDRSDSGAALEIDIHREGRLIATLRADRNRADLAKGGIGTGRYGFATEISPPVEPGFEFTLTATARASDGASAPLKRAGLATVTVSPEQRVVERLFEETLKVSRIVSARSGSRDSKAADDASGVSTAIDRLELAQARIEAALAAIEPPEARRSDGGLRAILFVTLAIALASLGLGLLSLWRT